MKTSKRKVRKYLKSMKTFSRKFDSANRKYLSVFPEVFERIFKVSHFAQVINFRTIEQNKYFTLKIVKKDIAWIFFTKLSHA